MKRIALIILLSACFNAQNLFSQEAPREMSKIGTITAIDLEKNTLSIERIPDKRVFTFIVPKEILSKFKTGQIVEVSYTKNDNGDRLASKVKITEAPQQAPGGIAADSKAPAADAQKKDSKDKDELNVDIGAPKDPSKNK